jgi:membrane-associated phospholipid phosphatase
MRFCYILLILIPSFVNGQHADSVIRSDIFRSADAMVYTFTSPARWKGNDWLKFGGVMAGTVALTLVDVPVRTLGSSGQTKFLDGVSTVGYHYGKPYTGLALTTGLYVTGLIFKSEWAKETGLILGTSLLSAGIIESTLKPLIGRARPNENQGNYDITFMNKEAGFHSFPSGHASMAFTISMVMARRVPSVPVKIFFYSLAASTAVCRIYSDAHWVSDVAFGGAIAWFCSDVIIKRMERNKYKKKKIDLDVSPYPNGLAIRGTF